MTAAPPPNVDPAPNVGTVVGTTVPVTTIHDNLGQEVIATTVDKVRLALHEHLRHMERKREWIAPLGLFVTLLIVFPTTEFKPFLGQKAEVWQAIFIVGAVASLGWLVYAAILSFRAPKVEDVVERIKKSAP